MGKRTSMGPVLKALGGNDPVDVLLYITDFGLQQFQTPEGPTVVPANSLINFQAKRFREYVEGADIWEFTVSSQSPGGPVITYLYVRGTDIATVKALSKIA